MTRRAEKQLAQLDALEAEFRTKLVEHLRVCASGRETLLFLVSTLCPQSWAASVRSDTADDLFATASEIVDLRTRAGLDAESCLARSYCDACRRHVDLDDHHRPGPRQQAVQLLSQLGEVV
ncbi:MAG: hypothetical protein R3F29_08535 [Planctomycetota bacterium]